MVANTLLTNYINQKNSIMTTTNNNQDHKSEKIAGVELYDIPATAKVLNVSVNTVRNYIKNGRLKSRIIGGKHMITYLDIQNFILKPQN